MTNDAIARRKADIGALAAFGGESLFATTKSTSNLVRPDFENFLEYSRVFYDRHQYTNNGPLVKELERRLARFHGAAHCVAFCSGFWAIAVAMKVLALPGKAEVVIPSLTYRRLADIAAWAGLRPRFCEVEEATLAQSAETVEPAITDDTAVVVAVHPIVGCCDIDGLQRLARERGLPLMFDSVESVYESTPAGKVGGFGQVECFSLHASKLLNGFEGGYVTTNEASVAKRLALTRGFGFEGESNIVVPHGLNAKLNEVHAAMALASLDGLAAQVDRNRERYDAYRRLLADVPGLRLVEFPESESTSYKNIVVELLDTWPLPRAATLTLLNAENVLARAYYHPPLHRKKMAYPHVPAILPRTDRLAERFMLLPCGHFVTEADIREIAALLGFLHDNAGAVMRRLANSRTAAA
jgi:dTDP-4-amino-4,6-dideoxygalactose transaminase